MKTYPKLAKKDAFGRLRYYWAEIEDSEYRTFSQAHASKDPVPSSWTRPRPSHRRTPHQQCEFEVQSIYNKRERLGWELAHKRNPRKPRAESTFYEPMLAQRYPHLKPPEKHWAQPKLDGVRCTATREGLVSRKNVLISSVPHVERQVLALLAAHPDIYSLDGELYLHGLSLHDISGRVRRKKPDMDTHELQYHIFDCTTQWASDPYGVRLQKLRSRAVKRTLEPLDSLCLVETQWCESEADRNFLHKRWLRAGYEGSMYRSPHERYQHKRSKALLKRKDFLEAEFTIIGVREGNGAWRGCAKAIDYVDSRGETFESGIRGTQAYLRTVLADRHKIIGSLGTVRYFNLTPDRKVPYLPVTVNLGRWDLEDAPLSMSQRYARLVPILGKKTTERLLVAH